MNSLNPYLMFNGTCEEAINFYADCLEGEITSINRYGGSPMTGAMEDDNKIMHATLTFFAGMIMAADTTVKPQNNTDSNANIHLNINFDDSQKMNDVFDNLSQGGTITLEIKEQFWGNKFGMLTDKFGTHWMFNCPKEG